MKYILTLLLVVASFASSANLVKKGEFVQKDNAYPMVKLTTTMGDIVVELDRRKAPITVNNFLGYVVDGGYEDTVFHRVEHDAEQERDFVIQGGGYDKKYDGAYMGPEIPNESGNGLKNDMYTIAMAYQDRKPHSATRQFFFNMNDNDHLNPGREWGFAVFGYVTEGTETLDKIMRVETGCHDKLGWCFVPKEPVVILKAQVLEPLQ